MEYITSDGVISGSCAVHEINLFAGLDDDSRDALRLLKSDQLLFSANDTIYQGGQTAHSVYVLLDGHVKLFKTTSNGKEQIIRVVRPGEIFGFDGLVDRLYNHSAVPLKRAEVCRIEVERLHDLSERRAEIERLIMVHCIKELQHADERLLELGAKRSAERLASFLLSWCDSDHAENGWTPLILSRREISQLLGLTIETVSRLFATWKREGLIQEKSQAIFLADRERLQTLADSRD